MPTYKIVFLRHGESVWNVANIFTGWADVDLSPVGEQEAVDAGKCLKDKGYKFDIVFTSVLRRSIKTAWTALTHSENFAMPIINTWRLNERHYGGLQGLNKAETAEKHGAEQVKIWRRSYNIPPPTIDLSDPRHPANDPLYKNVPKSTLPGAESLELTVERVLPFWFDNIAPCVLAGKSVLVAAHGNSLRAICKYLENMSEKEVLDLNIPTSVPLVYELDGNLKFLKKYYLMDPEEVAAKIAAVAAQGQAKPSQTSAMSGKYVCCTGGAGYIGSHTVVKLVEKGFKVAIMDNFLNSSKKVLARLKEITGQDIPLFQVDMLDVKAMDELFEREKFNAVIHFAGLKAVGESVAKPLWYYENNIKGTTNLLKSMEKGGCKAIVFSSSATVYRPSEEPLDEEKPLGCTNPYGWTKYMIEQILLDYTTANKGFACSILRYFNPVGAHPSGRIGESPSSYPNNLMPFIQQVAVGRRQCLSVFGDDYNTPDGTGVRDYIHVLDLAEGHICALNRIIELGAGSIIHNLGSGVGQSVMGMVKGFEAASGKEIPYKTAPRRPGDLATVVANSGKANADFGWKVQLGLKEMCESAWKWQSENPYGYDDPPES